jgi:hypothetical protein
MLYYCPIVGGIPDIANAESFIYAVFPTITKAEQDGLQFTVSFTI